MTRAEAQKANLEKGKATQFKAGEKQAEIARLGGLARQEQARERRTMKEDLLLALAGEVVKRDKDGNVIGTVSEQAEITAAIIKQAKRGNTRAYEIIRDMIDGKPAETVAIIQPDYGRLDEIREKLEKAE